MLIRVQRGSSVPISKQIDGQLRALIVSGTLAVGDQLPSVRQLARDLAVNVNTVLRVYERLAAEGLIELRHGDGTYVKERPRTEATQKSKRYEELAAELDALVRRGMMLGMTAKEWPKFLAESIERIRRDTGEHQSRSPKLKEVI